VDDAPVGLKLSATVLRGEGYKVHLASTAEQALIALGTFIPTSCCWISSCLVWTVWSWPANSARIPYPRNAHRGPHRFVLAEAEQLAYDAGCDGFIAKPIDTRTLAAASAPTSTLSRPPPPRSGRRARRPAHRSFVFRPEMEGLRRSFLAEGSRQVCRLLEFVNSRLDTNEVRRMFHQWVGSAARSLHGNRPTRPRRRNTPL